MKGIDRHWLKAGLAGVISVSLVLLVRGGGGLQAVDRWSYDLWLRWQLQRSRDERLLLVLVTDEDLVQLEQDQLSLATWQKLLFRLAELRPRVVGLDLPSTGNQTEEQWQDQRTALQVANVPVVVGCSPAGEAGGSLLVPYARMGIPQAALTQLPLDEDGRVRRYLLGGNPPAGTNRGCEAKHSLGLLVAVHYLNLQDITPRLEGLKGSTSLRLGRGQWQPLRANSGPYRGRRVQGWQMLLRPSPLDFDQVTLAQALQGLGADQVQGRVVLVGEQLQADGRPWYRTPGGERQAPIFFHAQAVTQILDQALDGQQGIHFWSEPWESLWIAVWGLVGVGLLGYGRRLLWGGIGGTGAIILIWVLSGSTWIPLAAPLLVWGLILGMAPWCARRRRPRLPQPLPLEGTTQPSIPKGSFAELGQQWEGVQVGDGNRYLLQRHLGGGGMGDVFLALDQHLRKAVAVKILTRLPTETNFGEQIIQRFQREIIVTAQINSIHIVQVIDSGIIQAQVPFYVMEYLRGQSLGSLIRQEAPLPVARTVGILTQVCAGLQAAHANNIVHRDLKPDNIFIIPGSLGEDLVKILDFGIARVIQETEATQLTAVGSFLGTYRYASPEQCDGRARLADQRADVYSLGLIAYEMLTATNPFGLPENSHRQQWLRAHVQTPPRPITLQAFGDQVPPRLAEIIMACLAKKPSERYADAGSLGQALQDVTEVFQP
ncbi:MAG: CHASE2 domain-containing protein [Gloeomargarita sp. DG02_3_bins_56]